MTLVFILMIAASCSPSIQNSGPRYGATSVRSSVSEYKFAVHPLHNPTKLFQAYQPLVDYLNKNLGNAQLTLEASRDYATFEEKYARREPHFLLPNPWQTLQAIQLGYHVIATAGEASDFKGIFIARKDSTIQLPADLKGKAISYPSATALAACIMPQHWLYQNHIDVKRDITNQYVGSQESSIMNVYLRLTAVGATWPPPWRAFQIDHPQQAAELKILWETESLINNSVMARDDVPLDVQDQIRTLLAGLDKTAEGKSILAGMETARFILANDQDYDLVRTFVSRFEQDVRKVNEP